MAITSSMDLQSFFPEDLKRLQIDETDDEIAIHMHSASTSCKCHKCGAILTKHHGSHRRTV